MLPSMMEPLSPSVSSVRNQPVPKLAICAILFEVVSVCILTKLYDYFIHDVWCDFIFKCGCTWSWAGSWDKCNVWNTVGDPKCPWCAHPNLAFMGFLSTTFLSQTLPVFLGAFAYFAAAYGHIIKRLTVQQVWPCAFPREEDGNYALERFSLLSLAPSTSSVSNLGDNSLYDDNDGTRFLDDHGERLDASVVINLENNQQNNNGGGGKSLSTRGSREGSQKQTPPKHGRKAGVWNRLQKSLMCVQYRRFGQNKYGKIILAVCKRIVWLVLTYHFASGVCALAFKWAYAYPHFIFY